MERNLYLDGTVGFIAGTAIGGIVASGFAAWRFRIPADRFDMFQILDPSIGFTALSQAEQLQVGGGVLALASTLGIGAVLLGWRRNTNAYGDAHWQSRREIATSGFLDHGGVGFVLGKLGRPGSMAPFLRGRAHPHCLMVAPTGAGKGVGFVIPNLLSFPGSVMVLDIKGENFEKTARRRQTMGDKVLRFDPMRSDGRTHRYNPLSDLGRMVQDPVASFTEASRIAELFILSEGRGALEWLSGSKRLFVACALLSAERGDASLGAVLRLLQMGGDQKEVLAAYAAEVTHAQAQGIFNEFSAMPEKTLGSYISVLTGTGGLGLWSNPAVDRATNRSDWDFREFRRTGHALYLCLTTTDLKVLAPLMRLMFGQAVAVLQEREPTRDEPFKVMFMVDEFDQLGRMDLFVESIKTLRSFGGRVMMVTQSTPGLDDIYGENARLSLEAAAGVKLYITPQDRKTARELSSAIGNRTRRAFSYSRSGTRRLFESESQSEREEAQPLLSEQDARKLDPDTVVILAAGQHPIKARRIKYYEDRAFRREFEQQEGPLPWPPALLPGDRVVDRLNKRVIDLDGRTREAEEKFARAMERIAWLEKLPLEPMGGEGSSEAASTHDKAEAKETRGRDQSRVSEVTQTPVEPDRAPTSEEAAEIADLMNSVSEVLAVSAEEE